MQLSWRGVWIVGAHSQEKVTAKAPSHKIEIFFHSIKVLPRLSKIRAEMNSKWGPIKTFFLSRMHPWVQGSWQITRLIKRWHSFYYKRLLGCTWLSPEELPPPSFGDCVGGWPSKNRKGLWEDWLLLALYYLFLKGTSTGILCDTQKHLITPLKSNVSAFKEDYISKICSLH